VSKKVALHTLGCKLNFSETATIGNQFIEKGFRVVDFSEKADVYIINTCTVTENAEKECRQIARRALRKNPNAFLAVTGCYAQLRPEQIAAISGVDAVVGSNEKFKLFSLFEDFEKKELSCIYVTPTEKLSEFNFASSFESSGRTRAFFKVQDGCDYTCTYCTIPKARGESRSVGIEQTVAGLRTLIEKDFHEVILTGVNVGDYGKKIGTDFYQLLKKIVEIEGDFRIRISSIEPNLLSDEIIDLTLQSEKLCRHFHIPLQSGSSKILRLMQRRYNSDFYRNLIIKLKERIPEAGIGVDVIVGFPGETNEDFMITYEFLKELPVSYLHVFNYSERPDTKAVLMNDSVDIIERKKRNNMLRILSIKKKQEFYQNNVGRASEIIFEHENLDGFMYGWSSNYVRIKAEYDESMINKMVKLTIKDFDGEFCTV
jgi:threonylcarbamoyladenosine tRNA methylthiotransferase MtaB